MAKAAKSEELKEAFLKHRGETEEHVTRLPRRSSRFGASARKEDVRGDQGDPRGRRRACRGLCCSDALDAGLLAGGQAVEHYEISRYGTLKTGRLRLGMKDALLSWSVTLEEEKRLMRLLSRLAQSSVNPLEPPRKERPGSPSWSAGKAAPNGRPYCRERAEPGFGHSRSVRRASPPALASRRAGICRG